MNDSSKAGLQNISLLFFETLQDTYICEPCKFVSDLVCFDCVIFIRTSTKNEHAVIVPFKRLIMAVQRVLHRELLPHCAHLLLFHFFPIYNVSYNMRETSADKCERGLVLDAPCTSVKPDQKSE